MLLLAVENTGCTTNDTEKSLCPSKLLTAGLHTSRQKHLAGHLFVLERQLYWKVNGKEISVTEDLANPLKNP